MSFLCNGRPHYDWQKKVAALDSTAYMNWRPQIRSMADKLPASNDEEKIKGIYAHDLLMDADELNAWNSIGVDVEVSRVKGLASNSRELAQTVYQISVANVGLMTIQRVEVLENECTDQVQRWLDKGWRILAVCPPNDARRPTYVMGHCDKDADY